MKKLSDLTQLELLYEYSKRIHLKDLFSKTIIFHGGCHDCSSQKLYTIDRCEGCQYFNANWNLPDLTI